MILKFNLLENSIDYLVSSIDLYYEADENGEYGNFASFRNKRKWKTAFILLCQATELILKYGLQKTNTALIYDNLDAASISPDAKTIDASKSLLRLKNLNALSLSNDEIDFVQNCFRLRNKFIHYEAEIDCNRMKEQFAKLTVLFMKIYSNFVGNNKINYNTDKDEFYNNQINELVYFDENLTIFRGQEVQKDELEGYKKELDFNQKHSVLKDEQGVEFKRIKYSSVRNYTEKEYEYCGDCGAINDEYHVFGCDIEECPKCGGQLLSCECGMMLAVGDELWSFEDCYSVRDS